MNASSATIIAPAMTMANIAMKNQTMTVIIATYSEQPSTAQAMAWTAWSSSRGARSTKRTPRAR